MEEHMKAVSRIGGVSRRIRLTAHSRVRLERFKDSSGSSSIRFRKVHSASSARTPSAKETNIRRLAAAIIDRVPDFDVSELDDESLDRTVDMIVGLLPRRSAWDAILGPFYTTGSLCRTLNITRQALDSRVRTGSLIRVRTVDGRFLYPSFQIHDGVAVPGLAPVVRILRSGTEDDYAIAQWLATPGGDGRSPARRLLDGESTDVDREARHTAAAWGA